MREKMKEYSSEGEKVNCEAVRRKLKAKRE